MIDVWGVDKFIDYCEINAFKYRIRAGNKKGNPIKQDIKKALWYEGKAKELRDEEHSAFLAFESVFNNYFTQN